MIYLGPIREGLPSVSELDDTDSDESTVEDLLSEPFCGARLNAVIELLYDKTTDMFEQEKQT